MGKNQLFMKWGHTIHGLCNSIQNESVIYQPYTVNLGGTRVVLVSPTECATQNIFAYPIIKMNSGNLEPSRWGRFLSFAFDHIKYTYFKKMHVNEDPT